MNKKRVIISTAIVVPIIGVVGFSNTLFAKFLPEQYVGASLLKTYKQVHKSNETESNKFQILKDSKGIQQSAMVKLKGVEGLYMEAVNEALKGMQLKLETKKIVGESSIELELSHRQKTLQLKIFQTLEEIGLSMPGLWKDYLTVPVDGFAKAYNQSELREFMDIETLDESMDIPLNEMVELSQKEKIEWDEDFKRLFLDLKEGMDIKYEGTKKQSGKTYKTFNIHIQQDQVENFIQDACEYLWEINGIEDMLILYLQMDRPYYSVEEIKEEIREVKKMMKEGLKQIECEEGLECEILVDSKKNIREIRMTLPVGCEGEEVTFELETQLLGEKVLTDQVEFTLEVQSEYDEVQIEYNTEKITDKDKKVTYLMDMRVGNSSYEAFSLEGEYSYLEGKEEDLFEGALEMTFDESVGIGIEGEGNIAEDKKNKKITLELEEVALRMKEDEEVYKMTLGGDLEIEPLEEETLVPSHTRALFKMNRSDLMDLGYEILREVGQFEDFFDAYGGY